MSKTIYPMPEGKMDAQLAEEFASVFLEKIEKKSDYTSNTLMNISQKSTLQSKCFGIFYQ